MSRMLMQKETEVRKLMRRGRCRCGCLFCKNRTGHCGVEQNGCYE